MLTRRHVLRLAAGIAACLPMGVGIISGWRLSGAGHAQEPDSSAQARTMESWMNEWMSVSKAPGGVLRLSRFREPIYFLTAPISAHLLVKAALHLQRRDAERKPH